MAHTKQIKIFAISRPQLDFNEVKNWLIELGVSTEDINRIFSDFANETDAATLIALAAKRCYKSFVPDLNPNVSRVRSDPTQYIENILKSGHGSVLEHAQWTFAIENVSRVFTGEMNRHRAGCAVSEGSMRYIRYDDIGYWVPDTISEEPEYDWLGGLIEELGMSEEELSEAKRATREILHEAFTAMENTNINLCNIWKIEEMKSFKAKKLLTSLFRRQIGMGIATGGVWSLNCRALRHVLNMRTSTAAEEEIFHVFLKIAVLMKSREPNLFQDLYQKPDGSWTFKYQKV